MMRSVLRGGGGLAGAAVLLLSTATPVSGQTAASELQLLALTNPVRASVGAPPLALDATLSDVARTWSNTMALAGTISHNPSLKAQIGAYAGMGENVATGPSVELVHEALVASPGHYANISNPAFTTVGLGVVSSGRSVYLTQVFVLPAVARSTPATAPGEAPPATAPTVAARAPSPSTTAAPPTTARPSQAAGATSAPAPGRAGGAITEPAPGPAAWQVSVMHRLAAWDRLVA